MLNTYLFIYLFCKDQANKDSETTNSANAEK